MFSFVAGYVDVVGFIALSGLFTAHVTGNFVMIGVGLAGKSSALLAKLLALPVFVAAVAATRLAESGLVRTGRTPVPHLLLAEFILLLGFMATGLHASPIENPSAPMAIVAGMLGVAAMGIQNGLSRTVLASLGPTTIMTGNTTQIIIDLVDLPFAEGTRRGELLTRLGKMAPAVCGFAAGAILGALALSEISMWSLLVPLVVLGALNFLLWE